MEDSAVDLQQMLSTLQQLQLENAALRDSLNSLQDAATTTHPPVDIADPPQPLATSPSLEPKVCLPEKFDGSKSRLRGFLNQIRLIFLLQPRRYAEDFQRVGLLGTLLTGSAQSWFAPLVETSSPLLTNFPAFVAELEATFGDTDRRRTAFNRLYSLQQGLRAASAYASEFRQIACDVDWDEQALRDLFRQGLRSDIKNLLLNFPEPTTLQEAISQAVRCDNRLFELHQEERSNRMPQHRPSSSRHPGLWPAVPTATRLPTPDSDFPAPMEIDRAHVQPRVGTQRQHRQANGLCYHCGAPGHIARSCPVRGYRYQPHRLAAQHSSQQSGNDNVRLQ
jgi:hypothetical protein